MAERLGLKLSAEQVVKQAETDCTIVDRIKAVLRVLKRCRSESARVDAHVIAGACAPDRKAERDRSGVIGRVARRLELEPGSRYVKETGEKRPYLFDQAVSRRGLWDLAMEDQWRMLRPGDAATSRAIT